MRASLLVFAAVLLACAVIVAAIEGGGECRNPRGVWECPTYNYTRHTGYEYREYHSHEVVFHAVRGRDIIRTSEFAEFAIEEYLRGNNSGKVVLNHTLPFSSAIYRGVTADEIAAVRYIPRRSVPGPKPVDPNVTLLDVGEGRLRVAVGEFFGDIDTEIIYTHVERLARVVTAAGHHFENDTFTFATYSPPEVRGAERRNEVWLHLLPPNATVISRY